MNINISSYCKFIIEMLEQNTVQIMILAVVWFFVFKFFIIYTFNRIFHLLWLFIENTKALKFK